MSSTSSLGQLTRKPLGGGVIAKLFHYCHALQFRFFQLSELSLLRRRGISLGPRFWWAVWSNPSETEDWVNLVRFLPPGDEILLLDIGANVGKFTAEFLSIYKNSRSVCFEPVRSTFEKLAERFVNDQRVELHQCGIADFDGTAEIRLEDDCTLCSLVEYREEAKKAYAIRPESETEQIRCRRIDGFSYGKPNRRLFVKIDVQGAEIEAIRGGIETLSSADAVLLECSFAPEHLGKEPSFALACSLLRGCGLYPIVFQEYGRTLSNYAFERDVLFVNQKLLDNIWFSKNS